MKLLRAAVSKDGIELVREFIEVESAKAAARKQFAEMVTHFKRNRSCRILLVEKTDRLYRNHRDALTLEELDIHIRFVKEGETLSKDSKSQVKFMHEIRLAIARNYSENLREEVKKGSRNSFHSKKFMEFGWHIKAQNSNSGMARVFVSELKGHRLRSGGLVVV